MRGISPAAVAVVVILIVMVGYANWRDGRPAAPPWVPAIGTPGGLSTSRDDMSRAASALRARVDRDAGDAAAAVALSSILLRQARVETDASLAIEAERRLVAAIDADPGYYDAHLMLGAVLLSQHRFGDAIAVAERASRMRPGDAWNYGVMGDGWLELGDYDRATEAYESMMARRPSAQAYARMSHVFEIQGRLTRALDAMTLAAEATSAHDPEAQAWHAAQLGHLYFQLGRLDDAEREYRRAAFTFPDHPYASTGLARVRAARHDYHAALTILAGVMDRSPTPETAAFVGDLYVSLGDTLLAERYYEQAERLERDGWALEAPQPAALARLLAEHRRKTEVAVELAERAATTRRDIVTEDTLAWAYFRAGRLEDALAASTRALRTGTRDRRILYHAAAIRQALGQDREAARLVTAALDGFETFDLVNAPEAVALRDVLSGRT